MRKKVVPEKVIQAAILKYLESTGLLFWRQNSGVIPVPTGRRNRFGRPVFRMVKLGTVGLPDIIAVVPPSGRFLGLEVKSATGKLRPAQEAFQRQLEATGGVYEVVRSVEDVERVLKKWLKVTHTSRSTGSPRRKGSRRLNGPASSSTGLASKRLTLNQLAQATAGE